MTSLTFRVVTDIAEAEKLWRTLSPNLSLFDDWDFRMCFHKYYQETLYFIAGYDGEKPIGLLPLQKNKAGALEFWCGSYMEDNRLFIVPNYTEYVSQFYEQVKIVGGKYALDYITGDDSFTTSLPQTGYKFVLPITTTNGDEYVEQTFHGETKKKLKKRLKKVEELGVTIAPGTNEDLELLMQYNLEMFADSAFRDRPHHQEIFREFVQPHTTFLVRLLTFTVGGKKVGVTLGIIYNDTYVSINRGFAKDVDNNFKEFVQVKKIEDAITLKLKKFDGMAGDYGWKERWGMHKIAQYKFEN